MIRVSNGYTSASLAPSFVLRRLLRLMRFALSTWAALKSAMNEKPKDFYRVFAPGIPNVRVISERLSEAEARSRKREILMAYPAATVRIEKADESGRVK